jgi:Tfp pilus assembly protein PilN
MSTLFTINFRRDAYRQEVERTRRRVIMLGVWVTYFGALAVVLGLYGLNCIALTGRVKQIEHQAAQLRAVQNTRQDWNVGQAELVAVERFRGSPRWWRDKLARLADLLPPNAAITSIAVNPDNLFGPTDINKLVISGAIKVAAGEDRMRGVVKLVNSLHSDSTFSAGYQNIQLTSSRATEAGGPAAEFVIECR